METFIYALMGAVQGLTEFLPISSSAHLVIFSKIFPSVSTTGLLFDTILHLGTTCSVIVLLFKKIMKLKLNCMMMIVVATIPVAIIGFLFSDLVESAFTSLKLVGVALLVTSFMNLMSDKMPIKNKKLTTKTALIIGFFQTIALIPGISRSGSTIFSGLFSGITKDEAADFSFLISIPAIFGANILQFVKYGYSFELNPASYIVGFLTSFVFGIIAIKLVFESLKLKSFKIFSIYTFVLGVIALVL